MQNNDQQFIAQKIRAQYTERTPGKLEELRRLEAEVKRPVNVFAYVFGSIGAIVMGSGMSLVMTEIGTVLGVAAPMVLGIVIGLLGLVMAVINYPMYKSMLGARRKKYAGKILAISEEIMKGE